MQPGAGKFWLNILRNAICDEKMMKPMKNKLTDGLRATKMLLFHFYCG